MSAIDTFALLAATTYGALAFAILRGKRVGGITFCKLGRFGFNFYFTKPRTVTTVVEH